MLCGVCSSNILAPALVPTAVVGRASALLALVFQVGVVVWEMEPHQPRARAAVAQTVLPHWALSASVQRGKQCVYQCVYGRTHPALQVAHFAGLLLAVVLAYVLYGDVVG